jgi:3-phosphoshikimate 1-carboxyvinyltransferase
MSMRHANLPEMDLPFTDRMEVVPSREIRGEIRVPGDKSISHRLAMIGGVARGTTVIENFAASEDAQSTLSCLSLLGVRFHKEGQTLTIEGRGIGNLQQPDAVLDARNSGTTVRLLSGILAANPIVSTIVGDESLSRRPMKRVIEPLRRFGATLDARDDNFLPLTIYGAPLKAIEYVLPVASAQVKSAILLAGLHAVGKTRLIEPLQTRNHTEIALRRFGAEVRVEGTTIEIEGGQSLSGQRAKVPGDISSAAFFIAAALGAGEAKLRLREVGLNPTRTGFVNLLEDMGARIAVKDLSIDGGEPVGDLIIENSELSGLEIRGHWIPNVIDEIPVLAVLGTRTRKGVRVRDAAELRTKESDRIRTVVENLRALGATVEEFEDGLFVPGDQTLHGGVVQSHKDHRIAMAFAVAALFAQGPVTIVDASCASVSFPGFYDLLRRVALEG